MNKLLPGTPKSVAIATENVDEEVNLAFTILPSNIVKQPCNIFRFFGYIHCPLKSRFVIGVDFVRLILSL